MGLWHHRTDLPPAPAAISLVLLDCIRLPIWHRLVMPLQQRRQNQNSDCSIREIDDNLMYVTAPEK